ncbi:AAA family ATPase [Roseiconus lacunae]|uniref:AAA family ATPase n=1 Tax=Roseiconus lacunae TaxID=2605694 RepID=UPI001E5D130A|nr:AAA family ATPase [Roseiconus lacunae]MCD0462489.1 AAA family ATPase [Roseiconus lacunae]
MRLTERLEELVKACFTGLWLESHEHDDAIVEIHQLCRKNDWRSAVWDIDQGLQFGDGAAIEETGADPLAAIRTTRAFAGDETPTIVVLVNFHHFVASAEVVQALARQVIDGKANRTIFVILSPVVRIPRELEKLFLVVEHPLPDRDQLLEIAQGIATEAGELPEGDQLAAVLDSAVGLTRIEAENAYGLSVVRHGRIETRAIWELKANALKNSGFLRLHHGGENFSALGGLDNLKAFSKRSLLQPRSNNPLKQPRGILLLGLPGSGKSAFARALGNETGRPTLELDVGSLMGGIVGETEKNVRHALRLADSMSPCILFIDELEKALSGATSNGVNDSGVSSRLMGTLLGWLNDHTSQVYVVATANDVSRLPPELTRAERFDAVVFLDTPGREQKDLIWQQYIATFDLDSEGERPDDESWTGAEIRSCCRLAALLDLPLKQAAVNVVPIAATAAESVERLRAWASGRCLDAENPGIYSVNSIPKTNRRRNVTRSKPSAN